MHHLPGIHWRVFLVVFHHHDSDMTPSFHHHDSISPPQLHLTPKNHTLNSLSSSRRLHHFDNAYIGNLITSYLPSPHQSQSSMSLMLRDSPASCPRFPRPLPMRPHHSSVPHLRRPSTLTHTQSSNAHSTTSTIDVHRVPIYLVSMCILNHQSLTINISPNLKSQTLSQTQPQTLILDPNT